MQKPDIKTKILISFILVLYPVFIFVDFCSSNYILSSYIKIIVIFLCFAVTLTFKKYYMLKTCMFMTFLCDLNLLFGIHYEYGVFIFILVHILHIKIHFNTINKKLLIYYITFLVIFICLFSNIRLEILCIFYILIFIYSFSKSIYNFYKHKKSIDTAIFTAYTLFAICDIFTLIGNLIAAQLPYCFIWIFYTPSQLIFSIIPLFCSTRKQLQKIQPFHRQYQKKLI